MKLNYFVLNTLIFISVLICLSPQSAEAYIGPGAGLSAIGAFIAVVFGVIIALFGFVWYPLKRLFRMLKAKKSQIMREK
jgi:hypothetical protein